MANIDRHLRKFKEHCDKKHGFDIELSYHIRNLLIFATRQAKFKLIEKSNTDELQNAWRHAKKGLEAAIRFVRDNVKISAPYLLSSRYLLLVLAYYLHKKKHRLNSSERKEVMRWIKVANMRARYGSSIDSVLTSEISEIEKGASTVRLVELMGREGKLDQVHKEDLVNQDGSSIFAKMMYLAFQRKQATDWNTNKEIAYGQQKHKLQTHHIFPQAFLKQNGIRDKRLINDIANLCFIEDDTNREISASSPEIYIKDKIKQNGNDDIFRKQCIPTDEELLYASNYNKFLEVRRGLLLNELNHYINAY